MGAFIARRLLRTVAVLFAVSVLVFLIFNVIPSNPARQLAGKQPSPQLIENIEADWGFDDSLPEQYATMMSKLFSGELTTYSPEISVDQTIVEGLPATFSLAIGGAVLWLVFGLLLGYVSAVRANTWVDRLIGAVSVLGISIPVLLIAPLLIYVFAEALGLLPNGDYVPFTENPAEWFSHLILPWIAIAVVQVGFYNRLLRSNMLDAMEKDYVRTARAKGLPERQVRTRHVLRNSLIPMITVWGLDFGQTLAGATVVVEVIFSINGVGGYLAEALKNLELPAIMGVTLYGAFLIVLVNTLVDVAYAYLDPRVRVAGSTR